jgi:hypothetical protein
VFRPLGSEYAGVPMRLTFAKIIALTALTYVGGCNPVFAPPMRSTHYGSPGRLKSGQAEVSGGFQILLVGGSAAAFALNDWLQLELGGDFSLIRDENWAIGFGGIRLTPLRRQAGSLFWAGDLEIGLGLGAGGIWCEQESDNGCYGDGLEWTDRFAYGGYFGAGLGLHIDFFSAFARGRVQISESTNIPYTIWLSVLGGIGFRIVDNLNLYLAGGYGFYRNDLDFVDGPLIEAGLSISFDVLDGN